MEPQDDPEARIRELEHPLTDQARTSELGTTQPIPPMPPAYTVPFPAPQGNTTPGSRGGWLVFAVLAVGVVALAAGVAVYSTHQFSRSGTTVGSPTSHPRSTSIRPSTPGSTSQAPAVPSPGNRLSIAGFDKNETIACNDSFVSVSGFSNTIVITGHCASLTVSGSANNVTVDTADTINASGFNNHVTFHSGSPSVDKSGQGNVVEQG